MSNIRFALACDRQNEDLERWSEDAQALRAAGKPTLPTSIGHEKAVNPFLRTDVPIGRRALSLQFSELVGRPPDGVHADARLEGQVPLT